MFCFSMKMPRSVEYGIAKAILFPPGLIDVDKQRKGMAIARLGIVLKDCLNVTEYQNLSAQQKCSIELELSRALMRKNLLGWKMVEEILVVGGFEERIFMPIEVKCHHVTLGLCDMSEDNAYKNLGTAVRDVLENAYPSLLRQVSTEMRPLIQ